MNKAVNELMQQEKLSSAFTLSDMEIFIFPQLFYPLVLSNIMSPVLWEWRNDPWFRDIEGRNFISRMNRIKQYIIDNYVFNLDLETWGLTTKEREIERFSPFFDIDTLRRSNALFGYEGDRYYFDLDIRKHFGLDSYDSNIIPYWKTETVEAMNAFTHKNGFYTGAGECVSLSALYAAAVFVVGRIPLENIYLIATPLHSQNFIDIQDGVITNNRRIVTRNMWFNGTSLSTKARRALENEKVTIVSHISGYIHTIYPEATIDREVYSRFTKSLEKFLTTNLTADIFINFLRANARYRKLFQYRVSSSGRERYITLERIFEYEHSSRYNLTTESRKRLIGEIDGDEFSLSPYADRFIINDLEELIRERDISGKELVRELLTGFGIDADSGLHDDLDAFITTVPALPERDIDFKSTATLNITTEMSRNEIIEEIISSSSGNEMSLLALYVYRKMDIIDWEPFIKASIERNNVSYSSLGNDDPESLYNKISSLENLSVYPGERLALPDEVWNFRRGDGIEKAILMASVLLNQRPGSRIIIEISDKNVKLKLDGCQYLFISEKGLSRIMEISRGSYSAYSR